MLYAAKLLNHRGYFKRLASLPKDRSDQSAVRKVERFLYRASCAAAGLEALYAAERDIVLIANNYRRQVTWPQNGRVILSGDMVFRAYLQIPAILTALVDLQNQSIEMVRLASKVSGSLPNSFNSWQKKDFPGAADPEKQILRSFWEENGKYIRNLRDVLEHHDMLGDVSFWDGKQDPGMFLIFLPDNPEAKSPSKFTYKKENDAFDVLAKGLAEIHQMVDNVCILNNVAEADHSASINLEHAGELLEGEERTLGLLMEGSPASTIVGVKLELSTTEFMQVVPVPPDRRNIVTQKLKLDSEIP